MKRQAYAKKRDANEPEIVEALEKIGASVERLDLFDLLVGYKGRTYMMEVKNPLGKNKLTESQIELMKTWKGSPLHIVRDAETAIDILTRG
ncbi:MAG: hypothetical protein GY774_04405 [Planctomycetes bacterium]|nr:hypothetical protein [Planctomycetota bacterium]